MSNCKRMVQRVPRVGLKSDWVIERINRVRGKVQQDNLINSDVTEVMTSLVDRIKDMFENLERNYDMYFEMEDTRDDQWIIRSSYPWNFSIGRHHALGNHLEVVLHCSVHFINVRTKAVRAVPFEMVIVRKPEFVKA